MARTLAVVLSVLSVAALSAQAPPAIDATNVLRVSRVVLYKTGIGYFEHLGNVVGNQSLAVSFTGDQLDDVLKSLTALDLGNGRVTGISYDSPTPVERRLQALRVPLAQKSTTLQLLDALRGSRIELRNAAGLVVTGRLLNVERRSRQEANRSVDRDEMTVVSDAGDIATVELDASTRVRVADQDLRRDVGRYLDIASSNGDRSPRRVLLATAGTGTRQVLVSYVGEAAVWKTTYRLVFPSAANRQPTLQGWAIVDNVSAADWDDVELSLVAGAPQAFKQPLSMPLFVTRPTVPITATANLKPQTHAAPLTLPPAANSADRSSGGTLSESVSVMGLSVPRPRASSSPAAEPVAMPGEAIARRSLDQPIAASAADLGELFEYRLNDRVTIKRNQSALVPILQAPMTAERISVWNNGMGTRPRRAVWLTNTSALTLDAGSLAIVDAGAFGGEGLIDAIKPGERRLVSFAADMGVQVHATGSQSPLRVTRVRIVKGTVTQDSEQRERHTYTIRNDDRDARTVIIEHPVRSEWKLAGAVTPSESTAAVHRFRVAAPAGQTTTLDVDEVRPGASSFAVAEFHRDYLMVFTEQSQGRGVLERAMAPVYAKSAELDEIENELAKRNAETTEIGTDQERVRNNMSVLKGSGAERQLLQRYTRQLDAQETRLEALKRELDGLNQRHARASHELGELIAVLSVDVSF